MLNLNEEQIRKIAGELDAGFKCFVHKISFEIISIPNDTNYPDMDLGAWEEDMKRVDGNIDQYFEIDPFESSESFNLMVEFTNQVDDENIKSRLIAALNNRKPFNKFKFIIDNSGQFRQQWFDFKNMRLQDWVRDQVTSQT